MSLPTEVSSNERPSTQPTAETKTAWSRPTRACKKCSRKFLLSHVDAHEATCVAVPPEAPSATGKTRRAPKKKKTQV